MLRSLVLFFSGNRLLQSLPRFIQHGVWMAAVLLSFNAYALDQSDGGCTETDGVWTCTGDVIVVTGNDPDPFDCRKNPANCLPSNPPRPSGASPSDSGAGGGGGIKEAEELNQAVLRSMDCGELSEQETLYKAYVEIDKALLEAHKTSFKEADVAINSLPYSESEMDHLLDLKNMACSTYEIIKQQRLNSPKECFDRPAGKPQICRAPGPTRAELEQFHRCQSNGRDLDARERDLATWKSRKAKAESDVKTWKANLEHDNQMLQKIRAEKKRKKCAS